MSHQDTLTAVGICMIANQPVILIGPPGNGKSAAVTQIAEDLAMHLEVVIASVREPSDFAGLPVVGPDGSVSLAPPSWAKRLERACQPEKDGDPEKGAIVLYDELTTAPPAVQAAMLRVVHEGYVGDLRLPAGVRTIAAANPPDQAADGWGLEPPMANRFTHLPWELDAETVRDGFAMGWPTFSVPNPDQDEVGRILDETMIMVGAFLHTRSTLVNTLATIPQNERGGAYATPRSWEAAARLYAVAKAARASETVINLLLRGTVGIGPATEFVQFANNLDLPDPEDLLREPTKTPTVIDTDRADKVYAIAAAVWAATQNNNTVERWQACGDVLAYIAQAGRADIAFLFGRYWAADGNRPEGAFPTDPVTEHLMPLMMEMGIFAKATA